jgi:hypothetical protein
MNISQQEASEALSAIHSADQRVLQVRSYRYAAPFLILWGVIWAIANTASDISNIAGSRAWIIGSVVGAVLTVWFVIRIILERRRAGDSQDHRRLTGSRFALMGIATWLYFPVMLLVLGPLTARQGNAFASLFWAFAYMFAGAWLGLRLFLIGLVTALAITAGFLFVHEHYFLWMAAFGGGSLIVGGLWLRKI